MKIGEFQKLAEVAPDISKAVLGECFLSGESMIEQKHTKGIGSVVSFYMVDGLTHKGYTTVPKYEALEE